MVNKYYVGITVGPIADTMAYSSAPVALWFASYLFSSLVRNLCIEIEKKNTERDSDKKNVIFTLRKKDKTDNDETDNEYYDEMYNSGIGVYHDRIYFSCYGESERKIGDEISEYISNAIEMIVDETFKTDRSLEGNEGIISGMNLSDLDEFLQSYFQIHYVIFEDKNINGGLAKTLSDALDSLELANKVMFSQKLNYIQKLMQGDAKGNNGLLRKSKALKKIAENDNTNLIKGEKQTDLHFRSILNISSGDKVDDSGDADIQSKLAALNKTCSYYAIVYADGDNMGEIISVEGKKSKEDQEKRIAQFSKLCTDYSKNAVDKIKDYGGVTIYAGGDDLLFLAPIYKSSNTKGNETSGTNNIWQLCRDIAMKFNTISNEWLDKNKISISDARPSISFGVSINYYKYPLYEALDDARYLLFCKAKQGTKNNLAVRLNKASGQAQGFVCCMETTENQVNTYSLFLELIDKIYNKDIKDSYSLTDELLHSVLYNMENKKKLYEYVVDRNDFRERITNLFMSDFGYCNNGQDNFQHEQLSIIIDLICNMQEEKNMNKNKVSTLDGMNKTISVVTNMIRVAKFLVEERKDG